MNKLSRILPVIEGGPAFSTPSLFKMKDTFHFGGVTARELLEDGDIDSSRLPPSEYRLMNSQARGVLVTAPDRDDFGLRHLQDYEPRQPS